MKIRQSWVLVAFAALSSCHSGPQIRAQGDIIKTDIDRARRSNALRCAPRELASAEANLDFAMGELDQGNSQRAWEHITEAEAMARKAVALSRDCAPKQVVVREQPQLVVKIEETDKDGDGVLDRDDQCPSLPGPAENRGCPVEAKDRDGDGIVDSVDRCIDQPEDKDGFQDADGCVDGDNDNDGIADGQDKCRDIQGVVEYQGCPVPDADHDGVLDADDKCPNEPGPANRQGCPFRDADVDGIEDSVDQCPNEAGLPELRGCAPKDRDGDSVFDHLDNCPDEKGDKDNQGCPKKKKQLVVITAERLVIKDKVYFATGRSTILAKSFPLLDQVAEVIKGHPELKHVVVEGHTDSVGKAETNRKLSQDRANAVMAYLVKKGVAAERLAARGYGPDRPAAENSTAAGREQNRRVEFTLPNETEGGAP